MCSLFTDAGCRNGNRAAKSDREDDFDNDIGSVGVVIRIIRREIRNVAGNRGILCLEHLEEGAVIAHIVAVIDDEIDLVALLDFGGKGINLTRIGRGIDLFVVIYKAMRSESR